jgi:hypothetical protein
MYVKGVGISKVAKECSASSRYSCDVVVSNSGIDEGSILL